MLADIIYLDDRRPFDLNKEPCSNCPPEIKNGCCTTCDEAVRWFNKLANLLKGKEETNER
jgi:hypothetical protein